MAYAAAVMFVAPLAASAALSAEVFPGGAAAYIIEINGVRQGARNPDRELPPASLTKVMTALLVLEHDPALEGTVTVSRAVSRATGTRLGLRTGEGIGVRELMTAALVDSANDACLALAEYVAGNEAAFVAAMNRRAAALALRHTHFTNACGHDEPGHRSSAADLARLASVALGNVTFAALVATANTSIKSVQGRRWDLTSSNLLLGRYPDAAGVKTGYTPGAGKCLIALARRGSVTVLLVVLNAPNRWWDSAAALEAAFQSVAAGRPPS